MASSSDVSFRPAYSGSSRISRCASARHSKAAGTVRSPGGSMQNRSSRARCTRVPLVVCGAGGSGRRSMAENLKASAQSLNDATLEGVSDAGSGRAIEPTVTRGCDRNEG